MTHPFWYHAESPMINSATLMHIIYCQVDLYKERTKDFLVGSFSNLTLKLRMTNKNGETFKYKIYCINSFNEDDRQWKTTSTYKKWNISATAY